MPTRDFYTLSEAAQVLEISQRNLLQRKRGHLRSRLHRARRAEKEEREHLLGELEQAQEGHRQERERADRLQEEANRLREELERSKGPLRRLFGGQDG